jgi:dTDP-4-dehydrorhamnose reductase
MSICILGSTGMLGSMVVFYCVQHNIPHQAVTRKDFNVTVDPLDKLFSILQKDTRAIVNCIGAIPQKHSTAEEYMTLNETFPRMLANMCEEKDIPLLHISTNCVFSGKTPNCTESDLPDAEDAYGISKFRGEPPNATVLRCSIIGLERTTACGLLEWFLKNTSPRIYGYTDSYWNGLTTYELARKIVWHIETKKFDKTIFHYASANTLSKYEILDYVRMMHKNDIEVLPKEAGLRFYTLTSDKTLPSPTIQEQIDELFFIKEAFYNAK